MKEDPMRNCLTKQAPRSQEVVEEFPGLDVFPEDLPAETPPEREINMRIPIKPGSKPPHQVPYKGNRQWE